MFNTIMVIIIVFCFIIEDLMVRSDTDVMRSTSGMNRSLSAPSGVDDDSLADVVRLQR